MLPVTLSNSEIEVALSALPGWRQEGSEIVTERKFETYKEGLVFASAIGWFADKAGHHPDLKIGYRKVEIRLSSHDTGSITKRDIRMAQGISKL
ncbi:4a-hydroxytetrahydrobiopterin dehydratase [bacterium]|nr:MAG: 4a-hydroxytetrahydrobiopterin dehydratase [bacterium]